MKTIHKFGIGPGVNNLELSASAKFLTAQNQRGIPMLWFETYTDDVKVIRRITHTVTGGEVPKNGTYLGTVQISDEYVVHIYELLQGA